MRDLYVLTETIASQIEQFFGFVGKKRCNETRASDFFQYLSGSLHFNRHNLDKGTNLRKDRGAEILKAYLGPILPYTYNLIPI